MILRETFKNHPLYSHELFSNKEYVDFSNALKSHLDVESNEVRDSLLRRAVPEISSKLSEFQDETNGKLEVMSNGISDLKSDVLSIKDILGSGMEVSVSVRPRASLNTIYETPTQHR